MSGTIYNDPRTADYVITAADVTAGRNKAGMLVVKDTLVGMVQPGYLPDAANGGALEGTKVSINIQAQIEYDKEADLPFAAGDKAYIDLAADAINATDTNAFAGVVTERALSADSSVILRLTGSGLLK